MSDTANAIVELRSKCLEHGASTIKGFVRTFEIFDDDSCTRLRFDEFYDGINKYGMNIGVDLAKNVFDEIDKDGSGRISVMEFIKAMKGSMSAARKAIVRDAFEWLDQTEDGVVTCEDLKGLYNVKDNPRYLDGSSTEHELIHEFLQSIGEKDDGKLTRVEFEAYYAGVSQFIENEDDFILTVRNAYNL